MYIVHVSYSEYYTGVPGTEHTFFTKPDQTHDWWIIHDRPKEGSRPREHLTPQGD